MKFSLSLSLSEIHLNLIWQQNPAPIDLIGAGLLSCHDWIIPSSNLMELIGSNTKFCFTASVSLWEGGGEGGRGGGGGGEEGKGLN